jgi:hypothetical protein
VLPLTLAMQRTYINDVSRALTGNTYRLLSGGSGLRGDSSQSSFSQPRHQSTRTSNTMLPCVTVADLFDILPDGVSEFDRFHADSETIARL